MQDEKMQDEKITRAIKLFRDAWTLLAKLEELARGLPEPTIPEAGPLRDWNDSRSYAVCVDMLQSSLSFSLNNILISLGFRNEWHIQNALSRPSVKG